MKYEYSLILRVLFSFVPLSLFYYILTPLTIYGSYLLLYFYNPTIEGIDIIIRGNIFTFLSACIAGSAYYLIYLINLLTKDIKLRDRVKMVGFGFLAIYLMNLIRIFILVFIALNYGDDWYNLIHLFFWKIFITFYVVGIWIVLVKIYKVKAIPIYSDIIYLIKEIRNGINKQGN